ncbi:MAG: TetR/AcrR family transcriptional regulator [Myxococcales bacterium]|nr:MAG: TetR/AcrR family transcriptional regulator [Myxococcales bacterium]
MKQSPKPPRSRTGTTKPKTSVKKSSPRAAAKPAVDDRRAELVRAAYELIAEKGLEELRTRDIAAKVGINIATLHYYFDTKEALVAAVVDHIMQMFRTIKAPQVEDPTALEELRHLFATQSHRRRVEPRLDFVVQEMMLRGRRDERVRARLEVMMLLWNGRVESIIERGVRSGELSRSLDPKVAAGVVTSCMIGSNLQHGVRPTTFSFEATYTSLLSWLLPKP